MNRRGRCEALTTELRTYHVRHEAIPARHNQAATAGYGRQTPRTPERQKRTDSSRLGLTRSRNRNNRQWRRRRQTGTEERTRFSSPQPHTQLYTPLFSLIPSSGSHTHTHPSITLPSFHRKTTAPYLPPLSEPQPIGHNINIGPPCITVDPKINPTTLSFLALHQHVMLHIYIAPVLAIEGTHRHPRQCLISNNQILAVWSSILSPLLLLLRLAIRRNDFQAYCMSNSYDQLEQLEHDIELTSSATTSLNKGRVVCEILIDLVNQILEPLQSLYSFGPTLTRSKLTHMKDVILNAELVIRIDTAFGHAELVKWEMIHSLGKCMNFDIETFEAGVMIHKFIF
ncbi:hypothetical protein PIB30_084462 [Stylosanthes scabra]|uniref:DUF4378 domain-containing protein n=1 Tax=Stylosanthes scabra TaxID=79078 RepID=A0ABU6VTU1_9FABA|nr:hypothetical protein [Stylosanthes scabra]